jgi:hypothetical protein
MLYYNTFWINCKQKMQQQHLKTLMFSTTYKLFLCNVCCAAATKIPNVFNNLAAIVKVNSRGLLVWHGWHGVFLFFRSSKKNLNEGLTNEAAPAIV